MDAYEKLEIEFGKFINNHNVVVCSSGTAALHLAFEVLRADGWREPEKKLVAVPETTMIACPRAVSAAGLTPKFVSVDTLGLIACSNSKDMDAALVVHLYGRQANTEFKCPVIEDLAEAHGLKPNPNSFAACWSFYRNKVICGEEGGAVAFRSAKEAQLARQLRRLGMTDRHDFMHTPRGMNYRMSNLHAEPILESLRSYDTNIVRRRRVEAMYNTVIPREWQLPTRDIPWVYDLDLPKHVDSWDVVQGLVARGIAARQAFKPMTWQAEYKSDTTCANAEQIAKHRIYLPIIPSFQQHTVNRIGKTLVDVVGSLS